jgi:hypothetical protein
VLVFLTLPATASVADSTTTVLSFKDILLMPRGETMRPWIITLAATVVVVILASAYDLNGRIADDSQKMAARLHESPLSERDYFSRAMQRWTPDDSIAALFAFGPAGYLLAGGLAISFFVLAGPRDQRNLPVLVFSAIGVIGCAAAVFGNGLRIQEFNKAEVAFAEWGRTKPGTSDWVMTKDVFLVHLVVLKQATLLMKAGLIAAAFALGYATVLAARTNPSSAGGPKP